MNEAQMALRMALGGVFALTQVACTEPTPVAPPLPKSTATPFSRVEPTITVPTRVVPTRTPEPQQLSERRLRGLHLEGLTFSKTGFKEMVNGGQYLAGKTEMFPMSANFKLSLNAGTYLKAVSDCSSGLENGVVLQFADFVAGSNGEPTDLEEPLQVVFANGTPHVLFPLLNMAEASFKEMEAGFDVTEDKKKEALKTYLTARLNAQVARMVCTANDLTTRRRNEQKELSPEEFAEFDKKWQKKEQDVFKSIIGKQIPPFLVVDFVEEQLPDSSRA